MKYIIAIVLCMSLLLCGCTATIPFDENTPPQETVTQPQKDTTPETPPPTGTDSTGPAPEIGPEGLPTPTL